VHEKVGRETVKIGENVYEKVGREKLKMVRSLFKGNVNPNSIGVSDPRIETGAAAVHVS
jgi:hypothetical protein